MGGDLVGKFTWKTKAQIELEKQEKASWKSDSEKLESLLDTLLLNNTITDQQYQAIIKREKVK